MSISPVRIIISNQNLQLVRVPKPFNFLCPPAGEEAGRASNTRNVILNKGEKIYHLFTDDHVPKDHKVRLKSYPKSFSGSEFTRWLIMRGEVEKVEEAVIMGQALLENGVMHHGEALGGCGWGGCGLGDGGCGLLSGVAGE